MMDLSCLDEGWSATFTSGEWEDSVEGMLRSAKGDTASLAAALNKDRSWALLSWVEGVASEVASGRGVERVPAGFEALSAVLQGEHLDSRDVLVVASLLRWAVDVQGIDWAHQADLVAKTHQLPDLGGVSKELPATFIAIRDDHGHRVQRRPTEFDLQSLRRRLGLE